MVKNLPHRLKRKLWTKVRGELSWIRSNGDFRTKERHGLIHRPNYAYGMLRAADCAKYFGTNSVTAIEFGVANGDGLTNMTALAELIERETGVHFRVVGFDTGKGLPSVDGFKDHPEIWSEGDFAMENKDILLKKLEGRSEIVWGNIEDTIDTFTSTLDPSCPVGFISVDVDIYTATKSALRCLKGIPEMYLPAVSMYFDDVSFFFANEWAGELAAISEFNSSNSLHKIGPDKSLNHRPIKGESWYSSMYVCHILDHVGRQLPSVRPQLAIRDHALYMASNFLN
jgi:hypothetical protein